MSDEARPASVPEILRRTSISALMLGLCLHLTGCCNGEGQAVITFSCTGACLHSSAESFRVELDFGGRQVVCENGECTGDADANGLWLSGRLETVTSFDGAGLESVPVRVYEEGILVFDGTAELAPRPVYCGCNENVEELDVDCRDARYSHSDWHGAVEYESPG